MIDFMEKEKAKLEALLFAHGEPVQIEKLASILSLSEDDVVKTSSALKEKLLGDSGSGLELVEAAGFLQLATKPEHASIVEKIAKEDLREEMTPAALETLTVIAYLGPVRKTEIDYVRGVNSSFTIRSLLLRGLIVRGDRSKERSGNFAVSTEFLKHLGLREVAELPQYETYRSILHKFQIQWRDRVSPEK